MKKKGSYKNRIKGFYLAKPENRIKKNDIPELEEEQENQNDSEGEQEDDLS